MGWKEESRGWMRFEAVLCAVRFIRRWVAVWWFSGSGKRKWAISLRDMISLHEIELGEELGWPRSGATPYALLEALFPTISPFSAPYLPAVTPPQGLPFKKPVKDSIFVLTKYM